MQIMLARKGDRKALVALIMEQKDAYYRLAYALTGNPHDAGDALEDMIVILFEKMHQLREPDRFDAWAKAMLKNCCRKILRARSRIHPLDAVEEIVASQDDPMDRETVLVTRQSISRLKPIYQEIIRMRYFLDYDYQAMADILQIPVGTVRSRLANGIKQLKARMEGMGWYEG